MKGSLVVAALFVGITLMATPEILRSHARSEQILDQYVFHDLKCLKGEMEVHYLRANHAPRSWVELECVSADASFEERITDPWGQPYFVQLNWSGTQVRVGTLGRDGKLGGEGKDADRSLEFEFGSRGYVYCTAGAMVRRSMTTPTSRSN